MSKWILSMMAVLVFANVTHAKEDQLEDKKCDPEICIHVEIGEYDERSQTFELTDMRYYGQGPWYTTLDELAAAIPKIAQKLPTLQKSPLKLVGRKFWTTKAIQFHDPNYQNRNPSSVKPAAPSPKK